MSSDEHDFYANAVNVITGLYDVTLNFKTQFPVSIREDKKTILEVSKSCNIRMSPQHAKSLAALLVIQVIEYEDTYKTELPIPPEVQEKWDRFVKKGE